MEKHVDFLAESFAAQNTLMRLMADVVRCGGSHLQGKRPVQSQSSSHAPFSLSLQSVPIQYTVEGTCNGY